LSHTIKNIRILIYEDSYEEGYIRLLHGKTDQSVILEINETIYVEQEFLYGIVIKVSSLARKLQEIN